jgi:WD40 repeat protein
VLGVEAVKASQVPLTLNALHDAVQLTGGKPLAGHEDPVYSVAWDPSGGRLASAGGDGNVVVWDLALPQDEPQP